MLGQRTQTILRKRPSDNGGNQPGTRGRAYREDFITFFYCGAQAAQIDKATWDSVSTLKEEIRLQ